MLPVVSRGVCVSLGICLGESSLLRDQVTHSEGQLPSGPTTSAVTLKWLPRMAWSDPGNVILEAQGWKGF